MKILLLLLFVFMFSILYAQDTSNVTEDKQIVGVVKIYLIDGNKFSTKVTYADTTKLKYGGFTVYDILIRSYLDTYPMLYPDLILESLRNNLIRYKEEYEQLLKE